MQSNHHDGEASPLAGSYPPFSELTVNDDLGEMVYVNVDSIRYMRQHPDGSTMIVFSGDQELSVRESVSDIFAGIDELIEEEADE